MISSSALVTAGSLITAVVLFVFWTRERDGRRKDAARAEDERFRLQRDLDQASSHAERLAGFIRRLQPFGVSPTGQVPRREFAETFIDVISTFLGAEVAVLFHGDGAELLPLAGRGLPPDVFARLRVRGGEGVLGQAAFSLQSAVVLDGDPGAGAPEDAPAPPYFVLPLSSQGRLTGLLWVGKPNQGRFAPGSESLVRMLAAQAALIIENHAFYEDLHRVYDVAVEALALAIEAKDTSTHRHSDRTRALVRAVCETLQLPEPLIRQVRYGALLHDVGKIGIEDAILKKPGPLTVDEYATMKNHPAIGQRILSPLPFLRPAAAIVLYHQEWYNGNGYPEGLVGQEIPLGARIVQIIDAWDAMTSDRVYRAAMPRSAATAELRRQAGTQFDPKLVETFLRVVENLEREGVPTTEQRPLSPAASR